jgi:hypothetical protein
MQPLHTRSTLATTKSDGAELSNSRDNAAGTNSDRTFERKNDEDLKSWQALLHRPLWQALQTRQASKQKHPRQARKRNSAEPPLRRKLMQ